MEGLTELNEEQSKHLLSCITVTQKKIFPLEELIADENQPGFKYNFREDIYPPPVIFFHRIAYRDGTFGFKNERIRFTVPVKKGTNFYTTLDTGEVIALNQKDRNLIMKNLSFRK